MARLNVFVVSFILLRLRRNTQEGAHERTLWQAAVFSGAAGAAAFFSRSRFSSPKAAELRRLHGSAKHSD
jgi:hypothetical protein